jgi:membrane protein
MRHVWDLISATFSEWIEDKAQRLGAALAYYAVFSLAPLLVIVVAISDRIYHFNSLDQIHSEVAGIIGDNAADAVVATMRTLQDAHHTGAATILSILVILIGATGAFGSLQDAMNTIWEVTPKRRHFLADLLRTRLVSFIMVFCFCLLLILSLAASAALAVASRHYGALYPQTTTFWRIADYTLSLILTTLVFATLYKVLPDVRLHWSDVSIGAVATAILFTLGRIPLSLYLKHSTLSSAYGAAGSVMVLLAWIYYSAQILFLGAEFTQVYAKRRGTRVRTVRGAVFMTEAARIHEGIPHASTIEEVRRKVRHRRPA